jgi:hypothetical protein
VIRLFFSILQNEINGLDALSETHPDFGELWMQNRIRKNLYAEQAEVRSLTIKKSWWRSKTIFYSRAKEGGFLYPQNYQHIRSLYIENRIHYVVANVFDKEVWKRVKKFAKSKGLTLDQIYLTNIFDSYREFRPNEAASI